MPRQTWGASDDSPVIVYARTHVDIGEASSRSSTGWWRDRVSHSRSGEATAANDEVRVGMARRRRVRGIGGGHNPVRRPPRQGRQHHADRGSFDDQFGAAVGHLYSTIHQCLAAAGAVADHRRSTRSTCPTSSRSGADHVTKVVVVVPAYEEEACIGQVVKSVAALGYDCVVVDDASNDRTAEF